MPATCLPRPVVYRSPVGAADLARGHYLGRALAGAPRGREDAGRLGRSLCGFVNSFRRVRPHLLLSIRIANENGPIDDEWRFTLSGPNGFSRVMEWAGTESLDSTYGPFIAAPGAYTLSGVVNKENFNGNLFAVEVIVDGLGVIQRSEASDGSLMSFNLTLFA